MSSGIAADSGCDGRDVTGHSFECGETEAFHLGRHQHQVGERKKLVDVLLLADEFDAIPDAHALGKVLGGRAIRAVADHHQPCREFLCDTGEDGDDIEHALDRAEVGEMDEKALVRLGEARTLAGHERKVAVIEIAVDEVADHFDVSFDRECVVRAIAKVFGDGGDAVGLRQCRSG